MNNGTELLRKYGMRRTPFRLKVLEVFLKTPHAAHKNSLLEKELGDHDRITLYRTLKTFEHKGLLHKVVDGSNEMKYALCHDECEVHISNKEHAHFHCQNCDKTYCLDNAGTVDIQLPMQYTLQKVNLMLSGLCSDCS